MRHLTAVDLAGGRGTPDDLDERSQGMPLALEQPLKAGEKGA